MRLKELRVTHDKVVFGNVLNAYFVTITPLIAELWLEKNIRNRKLVKETYEKYAEDMRQDAWTQCIAPIAFYRSGTVGDVVYESGVLADGQNRLKAVCKSGIQQDFLIITGVPISDGMNIDTGKPRTLQDALQIAYGKKKDYSTALAACSLAFETGKVHSSTLSNNTKKNIIDKHREHCGFAVDTLPRKTGIGIAPVYAAVGRAHMCGVAEEVLRDFSHVLRTGLPPKVGMEASAAIKLGRYLGGKRGGALSAAKNWRGTFLLTQVYLQRFVSRKPTLRDITDTEVVKIEEQYTNRNNEPYPYYDEDELLLGSHQDNRQERASGL